MAVLVDSNVLLDVIGNDPQWFAWSSAAVARAADTGRVVINPIIYAEISIRYSTVEALEAALPSSDIAREDVPYEAAFLAGKVYALYRRRKGAKVAPLPDFFIGAHAAVAKYDLLTRDSTKYRTYFPTVRLIAPGA
jgi:predicted nucleic acid-binding protein